jgi:hypothetical protein
LSLIDNRGWIKFEFALALESCCENAAGNGRGKSNASSQEAKRRSVAFENDILGYGGLIRSLNCTKLFINRYQLL